jgi:hypothetical protein
MQEVVPEITETTPETMEATEEKVDSDVTVSDAAPVEEVEAMEEEKIEEPVAEVAEAEAEKVEEAQPEKPKRKKRAAPNVEKQSNYIGVHWSKKDGKWLASRSVNGKSYFGGTYATEIEAARQSDALLALHGGPTSKGRKNFGAKPTKTIVKRRRK